MDCLEAFVSRVEIWLEIIIYVVLGFIFLNKNLFQRADTHNQDDKWPRNNHSLS